MALLAMLQPVKEVSRTGIEGRVVRKGAVDVKRNVLVTSERLLLGGYEAYERGSRLAVLVLVDWRPIMRRRAGLQGWDRYFWVIPSYAT